MCLGWPSCVHEAWVFIKCAYVSLCACVKRSRWVSVFVYEVFVCRSSVLYWSSVCDDEFCAFTSVCMCVCVFVCVRRLCWLSVFICQACVCRVVVCWSSVRADEACAFTSLMRVCMCVCVCVSVKRSCWIRAFFLSSPRAHSWKKMLQAFLRNNHTDLINKRAY